MHTFNLSLKIRNSVAFSVALSFTVTKEYFPSVKNHENKIYRIDRDNIYCLSSSSIYQFFISISVTMYTYNNTHTHTPLYSQMYLHCKYFQIQWKGNLKKKQSKTHVFLFYCNGLWKTAKHIFIFHSKMLNHLSTLNRN